MDRYRGDRDRDRERERDRERDRDRYRDRGRFGASNPDSQHYRRPTRFSDGPPTDNRPSPGSFRSGFSGAPGGGGGQHPFESPPRHHPLPAGGGAGGFGPVGGGGPGGPGGFRPMEGGYNSNFQLPLSGHKRPFPFSGRGDSPDHFDGSSFVKLFVGSVPRTVTEADVRPVFEEHGKVIEVAFIKDKRTGQQQGCCFIKYATSEEADRAIRALHNQYTLPGGVGPIQVRYADGERERLGNGAVEYKLFVGSLNKQATELEVKEIFAPYGRVEDVYLMRDERKQSRGCGFVKFSNRDSAMGAINSLNGIYTMRGCDRPLIVRFAEPKRSGPGEPRPSLGPNISDPMVAQRPHSAWQPITPPSLGPSPDGSFPGFGGQLPPRSGDTALPPTLGGHSGSLGGYPDRLLPGHAVSSSPGSTQGTFSQALPAGQQISPLQKPLQSPQHLPSSLQVQPQGPSSYPQTPAQSSNKQPGEVPSPGGQTSFGHAQPGQIPGFSGKLPSQLQAQQSCSFASGQPTRLNSNLRPNMVSTMAQPPQLSASPQQQLPLQQSSSQLAQMLTHQTQALQARFQSSQQAFSQIQQQLQMMQPSGQNQMMQPSGQNPLMHPSGQHQQLQHNLQGAKQQWAGIVPQTAATVPCVTTGTDLASTSAGPVAPVTAPTSGSSKCSWTEHTSPDGFKYYYNSASGQSTWVKPEELTLYEQQQQKSFSQQSQTQSNLQAPAQQVPQTPAIQSQTQFRHRDQIHYPPITSPVQYQTGGALGNNNVNNGQEFKYPSAYPAPGSVNEPARFQQALQGAHDWAWKNKTGGCASLSFLLE